MFKALKERYDKELGELERRIEAYFRIRKLLLVPICPLGAINLLYAFVNLKNYFF